MKPLLLTLLLPVLCACFAPHSLPQTPATAAPATKVPLLSAEALQADFDLLFDGLRSAHFELFARRSETEYRALHAQMRAQMTQPMSLTDAQLQFQRFVAYGRVAHARIELPTEPWSRFREAGGRAFPLSFRVVGEAVHVLDNYSGHDALATGARVLAVDGEPALAWLHRMGDLVSADSDYLLEVQLERTLPMLVWLQRGEVDGFELEVEGAAGERERLRLPARTRTEALASEQKQPPRFALDFNVRAATGLDDGIAYLRPGPFYDNRDGADGPWDPSAFRLFIDRAFVDFRSARATRLLIDLRDNPGGDNSFSDHLLAYIANRPFRFAREFDMRASPQTRAAFAARIAEEGDVSSITARLQAAMAGVPDGAAVKFEIEATPPREEGRFEGQVFALINRHSYSNAVMVAATLQDYGFGTLLGEETADLGSTLGAMERFILPRTGFSVGYPKARILRPNGNPQPRGVVPEVRIVTPLNASSEDEVLEQALQWIRAS